MELEERAEEAWQYLRAMRNPNWTEEQNIKAAFRGLASTCIAEERQRCIDAVLSVWSAVPEDHGPWKRCQNAIHQKIRAGENPKTMKGDGDAKA